MNITAEEYAKIEQEIKDRMKAEDLAARAEWRRTHKANVKESNRKYYEKLKAKKAMEKLYGIVK
ncbi:MAG: hypothetical protein LBR74_10130 [Eubacterium sp.]|nr:hypothetical protein [Eubacterium sp.]